MRPVLVGVLTVLAVVAPVAVAAPTAAFASAPPTTTGVGSSDETRTTATLLAQVDPNGLDTHVRFEYGTTAGYGASAPVPDTDIGSGSGEQPVDVALHGLTVGTTYHYRLIATNSAGTLTTGDQTFTTQAPCPNDAYRTGVAATLPECRAYEKVSPVDKNSSNILPTPALGMPDGSGAAYASYGSFAGNPSNGVGNIYASHREADGWQTTALDPPLDLEATFVGTATVAGVSADYRRALVVSNAALAPGAVQGNLNLYSEEPATDSYQFVATAALEEAHYGDFGTAFRYAGGAADGSTWAFELQHIALGSTPAAPAGVEDNLYVWSGGQLKLVGILPDGSVDPAGSAYAAPNTVSESTVRHAVSDDGSRIYWSEPASGGQSDGNAPIYLREGDQTKLVTERESDSSAQPGKFWFATPNGSDAYLTSEAELTPDSNPAYPDLYRYDAATGELTDLTPQGSPIVEGVRAVLSVSEDGSYIYFIDGDSQLFVWHDGTTRLIDNAGGSLENVAAAGACGVCDQAQTDSDNPEYAGWAASPDGRYLALDKEGGLTGPHPMSETGYMEVYLYSYDEDSLVCASCAPDGRPPTGRASLALHPYSNGMMPAEYGNANNVTDAGQLFFDTPTPLAAGDSNGLNDVYEYTDGHAYLISGGRSGSSSYFGAVSASGDDVFFMTEQQLVGEDTDAFADIYDARVDGGLASQQAMPSPLPCGGEACKSPPSAAPEPPAVGTVTFSGPGNPAASSGQPAGSVQLLTHSVRGNRFTIRVHVPAGGDISITGGGIAGVKRSAAAAGTYSLVLHLTKKAARRLARAHKLTVGITVGYAPTGGEASSASVTLSVKPASAKAGSRRNLRQATNNRQGGAR